ncbi:MAG: hypothetical protein H7328_04115 [Bdellovibrio sp.]|nr:hypothetical protein [Bdellovibrio sp.]
MVSPISFSEIFKNRWKQNCDFVVTVNAHRADYLLWSSLGLKLASKSHTEPTSSDPIEDAESIFSSLPGWIHAEIEQSQVTVNFSSAHSSTCAVIKLKKNMAPKFAIQLLSWSILKNCDLHILDVSEESQNFFQRLKDHPRCVGAGNENHCDWMIFSGETFMSEVLCSEGSQT